MKVTVGVVHSSFDDVVCLSEEPRLGVELIELDLELVNELHKKWAEFWHLQMTLKAAIEEQTEQGS